MAFDLIVRNATLPDGRKGQDVAIAAGRIAAIEPAIDGRGGARRSTRADAFSRRPSSIATFIWTRRCRSACRASTSPARCSRASRSGANSSRISPTKRWRSARCATAISPSRRACSPSAAMSTSATTGCSRSRRCIEVKKKVKPYLDLQLVAFPQDGYFRSPNAARNLERALDLGVDVVGGIPHFERTMADGAASRAGPMRDRGAARADGRPALRRERRSDVAPRRDPRLRGAEARPRRARDRIASDLDAFDGQLLCLEAAAADRRIRHVCDRQSAHQPHPAGPPRHLSEAARNDAHRGNARARRFRSRSGRIA